MITRILARSLIMVLLSGCGAHVYVADLGKVHVEILPQSEVQSRCYKLGAGAPPVVGFLLTPTLGCAKWEAGRATVYSTDSATVLLHELDHAVNQKGCHSFSGSPDYCYKGGKKQ